MSNKSYKDICDFYRSKNKDELTLKYFPLWGGRTGSNKYLEVYDNFCDKKFSCNDNKSLYKVIEAWEKKEKAKFRIEIFDKDQKYIKTIHCASEMPDLDFLKDIDIDLLNPCQNKGEKANQKWHLFVSFFAYKVVCEDFKWTNSFMPGDIICLPLRLWMIENAENQEGVLEEIRVEIDNHRLKRTKIDAAFKALF